MVIVMMEDQDPVRMQLVMTVKMVIVIVIVNAMAKGIKTSGTECHQTTIMLLLPLQVVCLPMTWTMQLIVMKEIVARVLLPTQGVREEIHLGPGGHVRIHPQGIDCVQEYDPFREVRSLQAGYRQDVRLYTPFKSRNKGRGSRFGHGGDSQTNTGPDLKMYRARWDTLLLYACEASLKISQASGTTATMARGLHITVSQAGVMDSRANISITSPSVVKRFNHLPQKWEKSFHITFGNRTHFLCTDYAYFGPILDTMAFVNEAPDTLVSIAVLTNRGFEVQFLPSGEGVGIFKRGTLLYHGLQHPETNLHHIDIKHLINSNTIIPVVRKMYMYHRGRRQLEHRQPGQASIKTQSRE